MCVYEVQHTSKMQFFARYNLFISKGSEAVMPFASFWRRNKPVRKITGPSTCTLQTRRRQQETKKYPRLRLDVVGRQGRSGGLRDPTMGALHVGEIPLWLLPSSNVWH